MINIADISQLSNTEKQALSIAIHTNNYALYDIGTGFDITQSKQFILMLAKTFGLHHLDSNLCADEDGITPLAVSEQKNRATYIPYSTKGINWHTDGYYNKNKIRSFVLHCVQPAAIGGANQLIDYKTVYQKIKSAHPGYIDILSAPDIMTIPENNVDGIQIRAAQTGPVFSFDDQGHLHMRYTARKRNITWKEGSEEAVAYLESVLKDESIIAEVTLQSGQGVLCNNVLHTRQAFENHGTTERTMLRARYHDGIN